MKLLFCCLLSALWLSTPACADEAGYQKQISAHLARHPSPQLRTQNNKASLIVAFSIDRDGKLLEEKITTGSGSPSVDQASLDWLKAVQPFPPVPTDVPTPLWLTLPIQLRLRGEQTFQGQEPFRDNESFKQEQDRIKRAIGTICKGC